MCLQESVKTQVAGSALDGCVQWDLATNMVTNRDVIVFCVKNLEIEITNYPNKPYSGPDAEIRYGLSDMSASLRFENCHFFMGNIWETGIKFVPGFYDPDHGESLSFVKNTEGCEFSFPDHSSVVFDQNDFTHILVKRNNDSNRKKMSLAFKGNKFRR